MFDLSELKIMTDKELDEALTNHMKKLDDLDTDKKIQSSTSKLYNSTDLYHMDYSGDWRENERTLPDSHLIASDGNTDWKCKTPYSISNNNYSSKYNVLESNFNSNNSRQRKKSKFRNESKEKNSSVLDRIQKFLMNYQEKQEIQKIDYTFLTLIQMIGHMMGKYLLTLFYIIVNIAPMAQIFLFIMRFILDKMINIQKTKDQQQIILKTILLMCQISCICICLTFIIGLIWIPILAIILRIILCCSINSTSN